MTAPDPATSPSAERRSAGNGAGHAVVRLNTVDPAALTAAQERLRDFDRLHTSQPGYLGSLVVDLGDSRQLVVNLWASREDADAALAALRPELGRTLGPLMSSPSILIGAGPVLSADLHRYTRHCGSDGPNHATS